MSNRQGFTIVEVLVAMVVLSVGVMALVGSSALVTRMIGTGQHSTRAVQVAEQRLERLRQRARSTPVPCANLANGITTATTDGMNESYSVTADVAGAIPVRTLTSSVTYRVPRGWRTLTLTTIISCE